eukprot:gnl/Ergobibamus_cyprinoides/31.p1 GENE.gnl/Ergobibamus_cyprinoides/31~~gnl/Ergobibamus_cyprinoides/31.p1  ORF type:complete len:352 (+),score=167.66 gnl/Ergobibamus_cyprinoides/31:421-1476(+)
MMIANASGCSVVWAGTTGFSPYTVNAEGKGPAWANSLFEDNAEFGYGMHVGLLEARKKLLVDIEAVLAAPAAACMPAEARAALQGWTANWLSAEGSKVAAAALEAALPEAVRATTDCCPEISRQLASIASRADFYVKPSVWAFTGDGAAYDIGFCGVDHVLASGEDLNMLVFDNGVYANTGGQKSKATPQAAVAKFAAGGKTVARKDLARMMMTYGNVYVAQVALGADPAQCLKAIQEAEEYDGPSLIVAYSPCISHGLTGGMAQQSRAQKEAVASGFWPIYRFDPRRKAEGLNPLQLDTAEATIPLAQYLDRESRFTQLARVNPTEAARQRELLQATIDETLKTLHTMAL